MNGQAYKLLLMKNHLLVEEKLIKGDNHSFLSLKVITKSGSEDKENCDHTF